MESGSSSEQQRSPERVAVLVDGPQLREMRRNIGDRPIKPSRLLQSLLGNRTLIKAIWYQPFNPQDEELIKFLLDFVIGSRLFELVTERRDRDIDVHLASDMLEIAYEKQADTIIVVSGDGGYLRAMRLAQKQGLRVEVASTVAWGSMIAEELRREADCFIELAEREGEILA